MNKNWYSVGNNNNITCGNCSFEIKNAQELDHHSRICPNCKIECILYDLGNSRGIQIITEKAPSELVKFIKWSQEELDELEFVELVSTFNELGEETK